jgi:hypothetical protein
MSEKKHFKTRQNSALGNTPKDLTLLTTESKSLLTELAEKEETFLADNVLLYSAVVGVDMPPRPMRLLEIENLGALFTKEILLKGKYPITLNTLIKDIEDVFENSFIRKVFLVAEGGQFKLSTPNFDINARIVFTWQKDNANQPDFLLSTVPFLDDKSSLLQLISWSYIDNSYHFFERKHNFWGWAGNSFSALSENSRGKGPFDSHINGSLVMKELKFPWPHWHSQSNSIPREVFPVNSDFRTSDYFSRIRGAEELENIVKTGIRRWTKSRIEHDKTAKNKIESKVYLRQIILSTTVNLISSNTQFNKLSIDNVSVPLSFLFDIDTIELCALHMDPMVDIIPLGTININGNLYKSLCSEFNFEVESEDSLVKKSGDTHFCFIVPERAFEDIEVSRQLIEQKVVSAKMILCLTLVDFFNPISSLRREKLFKYCPKELEFNSDYSFDEMFISNIKREQHAIDTPEHEFLEFWESPNILHKAKSDLNEFMRGIASQINDKQYVVNLLRLAESRKQYFRRMDLDEFKSTLSISSISDYNVSIDKKGIFNT